ncbi:MAG: reductive dehalogenase [Chloroflexi bacterium]|nr:reductive dehalogenase [Chloroflexota bacterium]
MSQFHSTLSRREFMKALGIGAGALAGAAAVAPAFQDLDELTASAKKSSDHPWWVKARDFGSLTTEVDWTVLKGHLADGSYNDSRSDSSASTDYSSRVNEWLADGRAKKIPGRSNRDQAAKSAIGTPSITWTWPMAANSNAAQKWEGTPEDNFQTLRSFAHYCGSPNCGALVIDDKMERFVTKALEWGTTSSAYEVVGSGNSATIKFSGNMKYVFTATILQNYTHKSYENTKDDSTGRAGFSMPLGDVSRQRAYADIAMFEFWMQRFITTLGYNCYLQGGSPNGSGPGGRVNIPYGLFSGLGEQGRTGHVMSPTNGIIVRKTSFFITDMPLAPTPPIDFGGTKFCESCMRCAEMCPSTACDDRKKRDTFDAPFPGGRPGYNGWRVHWWKCTGIGAPNTCGTCHGLCPFNHENDALIHPFVRASAAITPLFNGFYATMDRFMNYGAAKTEKELNDWWYRDFKSYKADAIFGQGSFQSML